MLLAPLRRGQARGELGPEADLPFLAELLTAAIWYRLLVAALDPGQGFDADFADALIETVLGRG